jgi:signal transduction histidine kinase
MDLVMLETDLRADCGAVRALEQVSAMHTVIDETIAAVRRISSDLRPALLDELGLAAALDWLAKDFSRRYAIPVSTRTPRKSTSPNKPPPLCSGSSRRRSTTSCIMRTPARPG